MSGYQGNIIIKNPATPAGPYEDGAAPGVWTLSEAMTFVKQGVWPTAGLIQSDPYFKNVSLLLHGNGTNGAQNNTFTNSATGGGVSADQGIPIQGSFSPYGSNWSNYFDGSGDSLSGASWSSAGNFGTGDFTIEGWFYAFSAPQNNNVIWSCNIYPNSTGLYLRYFGGSSTELDVRYGTSAIVTASGGWSFNEWHHIAVVRSSGSLTLYIDGVSRGSASFTNNCTDGLQYIGRPSDTSNYAFHGYVSNFRIVKGTAVYTSTFTPSTSPLTAISGTSLLTCQGNRFIDASTNNFTITRNGDVKVVNFAPFSPSVAYSKTLNGGSAYFDPNNLDRLNITFNYYVGNTDFTWEGWAYLTTTASPKPLFSGKIGGSNIGFDLLFENGGRALQIITSTDDVYTVAAASNINLHCWNHIALSRTSGTLSVYVNGVRTYNAGFADSMANSFNLRIGGSYDYYGESWYYFPGYLSDVRYSKTGRYSGTTITVPTEPLTNDANTLGLLNFTNAGIFDNSMHNNLRTVGNAQISTAQSKFGGSSMYFDGSGDYLTRPNNDLNNLGTGDFTIELWFKSNTGSMNAHACLVASYSNAASGSWAFKAQSGTTGYIQFASYGPSWNDWVTTTNIASDQQWHHCAVTRSGNTLRIFVDGVVAGTWDISSASSFTGGGHPLTVGFMAQDSTSYLNGYIDDLRITRGVARYTAAFTPPTKAFPDT